MVAQDAFAHLTEAGQLVLHVGNSTYRANAPLLVPMVLRKSPAASRCCSTNGVGRRQRAVIGGGQVSRWDWSWACSGWRAVYESRAGTFRDGQGSGLHAISNDPWHDGPTVMMTVDSLTNTFGRMRCASTHPCKVGTTTQAQPPENALSSSLFLAHDSLSGHGNGYRAVVPLSHRSHFIIPSGRASNRQRTRRAGWRF